MADHYGGGAFKLYFGDIYTIVFNDPAMIRSIWLRDFESFSDRLHTPTFQLISSNYVNLTLSDYPVWKKHRENVAHVFTKTKLKQNATEVIERNAQFLINRMKEFATSKEPFCPDLHMKKFANNIILNMAFSEKITYQETVNEGILAELVEPIQASLEAAAAGNICDYFHVLAPLYLAYKNMLPHPNLKINAVLARLHKEHLDTIDRENPRDILDQLIIAYPDPCDVVSILEIAKDIFVAGTETSANTLVWLILMMVNNPEIQDKAYSELLDVVGKDRFITVDNRINTPYTYACIKEMLRIVPIAPLGVPRVASKDTMVGDIFVPKGTQVIHNLYALHHDKSYWNDPEVYMPERFIGNTHTEHYLPFSIGARDCVGKDLAASELYVAFANMMINFRFTSTTGKPIDETEKFAVTIGPLAKYSVYLESRS
eukprot:gene17477-20852_t